MKKVKIFHSDDTKTLENMINEFICNEPQFDELIDVKYSTYNLDDEHAGSKTALMIYESQS